MDPISARALAPAMAAPSPLDRSPQDISVEEFDSWPLATKQAYIENWSQDPAGSDPRSVLIGPGTNQSRYFFMIGTPPDARVEQRPSTYFQVPISHEQFMSHFPSEDAWTDADRRDYIMAHGTVLATGTRELALTKADGRDVFVYVRDGVLGQRPDGYGLPTYTLRPDTFLSWSPVDQADYFASNASFRDVPGGPLTLYLGNRVGQWRAVYMDRNANNQTVFALRPEGWMGAPSLLSPAVFDTWPEKQRIDYLRKQFTIEPSPGERRTVEIGSGTASATYTLSRSAAGEYTASKQPSGSGTSPGTLDPEIFYGPNWTEADRLAYLDRWAGQARSILPYDPWNVTPAEFKALNAVQQAIMVRHWSTDPVTGFRSTVEIGDAVGRLTVELRASRVAVLRETNSLVTPDSSVPRGFSLSIQPRDLSLSLFQSWDSAYQKAYVAKFARDGAVTIGQTGQGKRAGDDFLTFMRTNDRSRLLAIETLDKRTIAGLAPADQTALAGNAIFRAAAAAQGLSTSRNDAKKLVDDARARLPPENGGARNPAVEGGWNGPYVSHMGPPLEEFQTERAYFVKQLDLLEKALDRQTVFSSSDLADSIKLVTERADRWSTYWPVHNGYDKRGSAYVRLQSLGGPEGLHAACKSLVDSERRILENEEKRLDAARSRRSDGRTADLATLIFELQQSYNRKVELRVAAETVELNQINDLLKAYTVMQSLVNKTLGMNFGTDGKANVALAPASDLDWRAISLFDQWIGGDTTHGWPAGSFLHPAERHKLSGRRERDVLTTNTNGSDFSLVGQPQSFWNSYNSRLGSMVSTINQEAQVKMNEVNSLDKQKNRHFELANNALSKMSELLQSITRNVA
ncbi:hypothetical protein [Chthonobacter rhizosphaerae]|uniref:hypothetical protein n=1 Tax=Chthonobacter rhizosphaerae TaxID=2735553 RepID=UPI0015EEBB72|nr:hypothetical protein [Chthonobacter rhizosphaerae]